MSTRRTISTQLSRVGQDAKTMSRNLWLASLGAVGTADEARRDLFSHLVQKGEDFDVFEDSPRMRWDNVVGQAKTLGDRIEGQVEVGMSKTLNRLGVPARRDIEELSERVATLTRHVEALR